MLELLASGFISTPVSAEQLQPGVQQQCPSIAEVYNTITADAAHCPDQAVTPKAPAASSDASTGMQQAGRTTSSSSYTSSAADGDSSSAWQPDAVIGSAAAAQQSQLQRSGPGGVAAHSAYFPALGLQQQQPQHSAQPQQAPQHSTCRQQGINAALASVQSHEQGPDYPAAAAEGAAPLAAPLSSPAGASGTWQDALQQGLFVKLAQQSGGLHGSTGTLAGPTQHQYSTPPSKAQQRHAAQEDPASAATQQHSQWQRQHVQDTLLHSPAPHQQHAAPARLSTGFEVEGGLLSTTSSSSQSAHSELLDSDDLDELAGLCDTLLQQHAKRPQQPAGAAQGQAQTSQQQRQQHVQQGLAGTAWPGSAGVGLEQAFSLQHGSMPATVQGVASQACAPGLQALAAQLCQLQEQVSATVMDAVPARSTSSNGGGTFGSTTPSRQAYAAGAWAAEPAHAGPSQHGSMHGPAGSTPQHSMGGQRRGSTGSSSAGLQPTQPPDSLHGFCEGPAMTSLQQQLAQRMQEVKERLSNICSGMLQDGQHTGQGPSSNIQTSNSFFSPPASPAAEHMPPVARPWQEHSSAGKHAAAARTAPAGQAGVRAAAGSHSGSSKSGSGPGSGKSPAAGAGKLGAAGWDGAGRWPAKGRATSKAAGTSKQSPAPAEMHSSDPSADAAAAAFAAIKASIASDTDLPGFFTAGSGSIRPRVATHPQDSAAGGAASARGSAEGLGHGSSTIPAAACQGSWASAEDVAAAAEDSDGDGSWATVSDESEQEKLQQQQQQQANEAMVRAAQHAMNEQHRQQTEDVTSLGADSRSSSSLGGSPNPTHKAGSQKIFVGGWSFQQQQQQGQQELYTQHGACSDMPGQHTPQRARQDTEQAASPVSCESSMLAGSFPARMPAEVVFSPMKASGPCRAGPGGPAVATAGPDGAYVTPLRPRNV